MSKPGFIGPRLWLVPRYTEKHGTVMRLGSILTNPEDLESSLNLHNIPAIPERSKRDLSDSIRKSITQDTSSSKGGLLGVQAPLPILGGLLSAGGSSEVKNDSSTNAGIEATHIRATVFIADKEYMDSALKDQAVLDYTRKGLFGVRLYVVVGVATAGSLTLSEGSGRETLVNLGAQCDAAGVAGGEAGINYGQTATTNTTGEFIGESDFAYRVREFYYSKIRQSLSDEGNRTKSALLGAGRQAADVEETEEVMDFLFFEDTDEDDDAILSDQHNFRALLGTPEC